ncbi:hypothetical protein ABZP36_019471 [Zizania latifolia]
MRKRLREPPGGTSSGTLRRASCSCPRALPSLCFSGPALASSEPSCRTHSPPGPLRSPAGDAVPPPPPTTTTPRAGTKGGRRSAPPMGSVHSALFFPPGVEQGAAVAAEMVIPASNIVAGPYAGDARVKEAEFFKSSARARDCPKDDRPEFAVLGRSNVGKSSLINALIRRKEAALTSKKPGKTQTINHFLVNKSWYLVDLPGYGFAAASQSARMDWSSFTKGYFLNRDTLVGVLLLIGLTFVFTKCDKSKKGKGGRPEENIKEFQDTISALYPELPSWIMTSSVTGLGRDGLLLHVSQLRNYWDNESTMTP